MYYTGALPEDGKITTKVGFDAGTVEGITEIKYDRSMETTAQDVVIRTNSFETTLSINGYVDPSDTTKGDVISHYGYSGLIDVILKMEQLRILIRRMWAVL